MIEKTNTGIPHTPFTIKPMPRMNKWSHYPIVGSFVGAARIFKGGAIAIKGLGEKINDYSHKKNDGLGSKHIIKGLSEIHRGVYELVPIMGNFIAIFIDSDKAQIKILRGIAHGQYEDAVKMMKEWVTETDVYELFQRTEFFLEKNKHENVIDFYIAARKESCLQDAHFGNIMGIVAADLYQNRIENKNVTPEELKSWEEKLGELSRLLPPKAAEAQRKIETIREKIQNIISGQEIKEV